MIFDLGFDEWLATQNTGVFEEQLNSLSAEENGSSVTDGIQPQPKKPKLSLLLKKKRQPLKEVTNMGRFASPVTKEAYNEAGKGMVPAKRQVRCTLHQSFIACNCSNPNVCKRCP